MFVRLVILVSRRWMRFVSFRFDVSFRCFVSMVRFVVSFRCFVSFRVAWLCYLILCLFGVKSGDDYVLLSLIKTDSNTIHNALDITP